MRRIGLIICIALSFMLVANAQTFEEFEELASKEMSNANFSGALDYYKQAIALVPDEVSHPMTYAYAGMCAQELGDLASAKSFFLESVNRGIEEPRVFDSLGEIARKEKDYDTQLIAYNAGLERSPADKEKYLIKLCTVYKKQKNADALYETALKALEVNPQNLKGIEYKGTALQYQKKMTEAEVVFTELYALDKENVNANVFLGNYNYQVGKNKLASARKKYEALAKPTRVQWHDNTENSKALMEKYYRPAIMHLEYVYTENPNKSIKNMLFVMYTKLGETEKATVYQE